MNYIAIIGDIEKSREINDRYDFQVKLKETLDRINQDYAAYMISDFTITLGDEFQGIVSSGLVLMKIIYKIEVLLKPVKVKFGIGLGEITTAINKRLSIGADGPAYWSARAGVNLLKQKSKYKNTYIYVAIDELYKDKASNEMYINSLLDLMEVTKNRWKNKQYEAYTYIIENDASPSKYLLKDLHKMMGIKSPQIISERLLDMNYYQFENALEALGEYIEEARRQLCRV